MAAAADSADTNIMTDGLITLGRYTLIRRLAAGGMGEVYLAEIQGAANFSRRVAIKRILPHLAQDESFVHKFIDEANLMVRLHHGNIVPVIELADHDGELYLVMEYLPGRDLKALLKRMRTKGKVLPPNLAIWLITEVLAGLDYAHRLIGEDGAPLHIVHRDVSPSNVVLGAGGSVKLTDFGIARARGGLHQSISGTLQGKFIYMSPEQADGRPLDARSDVFSAGLVLYELLCGIRPFEGQSETETLRLVRQAKIEPPSHVRGDLEPALDALLLHALAREPNERYATAGNMRHELLHYLAGRRSTADAGTLAEYLADLFPEGVIPSDQPEEPMSLDDVLNAQLNALTPSVDAMGRTRTLSAPEQPVIAPISVVSVKSQPIISTTGTHTAPAQLLPGRRRFLMLGLLLGATAAGGLAFFLLRPAELVTLNPSIRGIEGPLTDFVLTLGHENGDEVDVHSTWIAGSEKTVCARVPGFEPKCKRITFRPGINPLQLQLERSPTLNVVLDPPTADATIRIDGVQVDRFPYRLTKSRSQVQVTAVGYTQEHQETVERKPGAQTITINLLSVVPDAGLPPPVDAARPPPVPKPIRNRVTKTRVALRSTPTAEIWSAGKRIGTTPHTLSISRPQAVELRAKNHVTKRIDLSPNQRGPLKITLLKFAQLTVRAIPPASVILVDGKPIRTGLVRALPVPPGKHTVIAQLKVDGKMRRAKKTVTLSPGEHGATVVLEIPGL